MDRSGDKIGKEFFTLFKIRTIRECGGKIASSINICIGIICNDQMFKITIRPNKHLHSFINV